MLFAQVENLIIEAFGVLGIVSETGFRHGSYNTKTPVVGEQDVQKSEGMKN